MPLSPNDTAVTADASTITDALNNTWTLDNGQVAVEGMDDPTTANMIELAYVNGQIWQENANYLWWAKSSPSDPWSPNYGTSVSPLPASTNPVSADNAVATRLGQTITDANHNTWSISGGGQVATNGASDPTTGRVIELAYEQGQVWQENADGLWWAKSQPSDTWLPTYGTSVSPVPSGSTPSVAPITTRVWLGGGDNAASDPNNWSPLGVPQPGDALRISNAAMIDVAGNDLAGDTLTVNTTNSVPVTINTSGNAQLNLAVNFSGPSVDLAASDTTTLNLSMIHGNLNTTGDTIQFIGNSVISASAVHFNNTLTGDATVALGGGLGEGTSAEINGSVEQGLTFDIGRVAALRIDHPDQFAGVLNFGNGFPLHSVLLEGLTATSGELQNGVLNLFNGDQLIDSTRVTGNTSNLTLDQSSAGVTLSERYLGGSGGTPATLIPFTQTS